MTPGFRKMRSNDTADHHHHGGKQTEGGHQAGAEGREVGVVPGEVILI